MVFGSLKKTFISKTVHHEAGKEPKTQLKIHIKCSKCLKICLSQVFVEWIQNRVSPNSADLEAAYLEALLYINMFSSTWTYLNILFLFQTLLSQKLLKKTSYIFFQISASSNSIVFYLHHLINKIECLTCKKIIY